MAAVSIILQFLGAISGLGALCVGIRWLYFRFCSKKLYYTHKLYPVSEHKYYHLVAIWNPTYQSISANDITKPLQLAVSSHHEPIYVIRYTDKCLVNSIQDTPNYNLKLNFDSFPQRSGFLFAYISELNSIYFEGEIKNQRIKEINYNEKIWYTSSYFFALLGLLLIPSQFIATHICALGFILCGYMALIGISVSLEHYFYHPKMPAPLWKAFQGKNYWY